MGHSSGAVFGRSWIGYVVVGDGEVRIIDIYPHFFQIVFHFLRLLDPFLMQSLLYHIQWYSVHFIDLPRSRIPAFLGIVHLVDRLVVPLHCVISQPLGSGKLTPAEQACEMARFLMLLKHGLVLKLLVAVVAERLQFHVVSLLFTHFF